MRKRNTACDGIYELVQSQYPEGSPSWMAAQFHCAAREPTIAYVTGTEWERFGSFVMAMTMAALETSAQLM